ncbi:MAG: AAA family ATPase [Deltaproteobacteria bacterium]|nr:AAA family ATPase [Deltaproteobacteria bacterium]
MSDVPIDVILIGLDEQQEQLIERNLGGQLNVVASEPSPEHGLTTIAANPDAIALLFLDAHPEQMLRLTHQVSSSLQTVVVVLSATRDPHRIVQVMKAGAKDYAIISDDNVSDVERAIHELSALHEQILKDKHGKVISVFSAKGGSGATTVAANLGNVLQRNGLEKGREPRKIVLLDFDMDMGDLSIFLDVRIGYSYQEILDNMYRLDSELLYGSLTHHSNGLYIVSHCNNVDAMETVAAKDLTRIVVFLKQHFDFVIIDGLRGFSEKSLAALDNSDHIVITLTPDIPSLRNANRSLQIFGRLRYTEEHVHLVLNRYNKKPGITADEMADALGRPITCTVANDFPLVNKSAHQGTTAVDLSPKSKVAADFQKLGYLFVDAPKRRRRSFLPFRRA